MTAQDDFTATLAALLPDGPQPDPLLRAARADTPLGHMIAVADDNHLYLLEFLDRAILPAEFATLTRLTDGRIGEGHTSATDQAQADLDAYFAGQSARFTTPLAPQGTEFSRMVWDNLQTIPPGQTRSYAAFAAALGRPNSTRAVGRANGANPIAILIPCHRLVGANGALTGYGGGLWRKQALLELERQYA